MNTCPKCEKELRPFDYHEIELLTCSECKGFWFKDGKFRETKQIGFSELVADVPPELLSESTSDSSPAQEMMCPDCEESLVAFMYAYSSDIQLHRCSHCRGIWTKPSDLLRIEELLTGYRETLADAKMKVFPLILKTKKQIQQEEQARKEEQKQAKKPRFLGRLFGQKRPKNRNIQNILEDFEKDHKEDS